MRVVTFNIRYGHANDGDNAWNLRKRLIVESIRRLNPDILEIQESMDFQTEYLQSEFPEYDWLGVGRAEGGQKGEMAPIFFRKCMFTRVASGHFWLSETPERPGSKSWGGRFPRVTTWVSLTPLPPNSSPITCFNSHFDHVSAEARHESAKLLRAKIARSGSTRVVVTGDFNEDAGGIVYRALVGSSEDAVTLVDTAGTTSSLGGTFHEFSGRENGERIDWILTSPQLCRRDSGIDRTSFAGRHPSDHFPVFADITCGEDGRCQPLADPLR